MGFAAIFIFIFMLNGLPCLGDANAVNNRVNSIRIFQDNRELLKSPQKINLGQSLVVPKLLDSELDKIKIWGVFPNSMFEVVKSIGRRHLPDDNGQSNQSGHYIVRDGDTLWNIAAEQLGNPSRYKEISKLNADVLKNENELTIGMQLSLPDR
jgi:nucleoid-associated protein YgaU